MSNEAARIARKLSLLGDLGLKRVEAAPVSVTAEQVGKALYKVTHGRPAMGTFVSVTALHPSRNLADEAIGAAFEQMDQRIAVFNRFDGASAVSQLNREGRLADAPPEFSRVVGRALHYYRLSHGTFDVTVKPLVDLLSRGTAEPDEREIGELLELVGSKHIELSPHAVRFRRAGVGITLDGIAKGHIVDRIADCLDRHGLANYLVNAGGDIRTAGTRERGEPWAVAVQHPDKTGEFPDIIRLRAGAVATSGSYEIYFDRERKYHHIVNSRTGASPNVSASVSVLAPTAMAADALATSAFLMDPAAGLRFIGALPQCECMIIDRQGGQWKTEGWAFSDSRR
jgi:thiamine biosynthesis lipoprotein